MFSVNERSTVAVEDTPTVPTPITWNPLSSLLLKYGFVKLTSLYNSKSNKGKLERPTGVDKLEWVTSNWVLYPRVNDTGGLIRAILWPDPVDVNDIAFGATFLDWKEVSLNLNVLSSILITKYVKLLKSGVIGFEDW